MEWIEEMGEAEFCKNRTSKKSRIGIWELLAVLTNLRLMKRKLRGKKAYFFVDSIGDVRILAKATANCVVCRVIVNAILIELEEAGATSHYSIHIKTDVNPADLLTRLNSKRLGKLKNIRQTAPGIKVLINSVGNSIKSAIRELLQIIDSGPATLTQNCCGKISRNPAKPAKRRSARAAGKAPKKGRTSQGRSGRAAGRAREFLEGISGRAQ